MRSRPGAYEHKAEDKLKGCEKVQGFRVGGGR